MSLVRNICNEFKYLKKNSVYTILATQSELLKQNKTKIGILVYVSQEPFTFDHLLQLQPVFGNL